MLLQPLHTWYFSATAYGSGSYFAKFSWYSAQKLYAQPNKDGVQFVFQTRVLTGDYCKGQHEHKVAPFKDKTKTQQYDSVVNDMKNPYIYVVFSDDAAYPDYIVKFVKWKLFNLIANHEISLTADSRFYFYAII